LITLTSITIAKSKSRENLPGLYLQAGKVQYELRFPHSYYPALVSNVLCTHFGTLDSEKDQDRLRMAGVEHL